MTEEEAKSLIDQIKYICKKYGAWYKEEKNHKPELKDIVLTVSIKIK